MAEEKSKKVKRPTAQKRMLRNEKQQERNKMFKSRVRTAVRTLEENIKKGSKEGLEAVYSLMDKAVKRGIYKRNKAARIKSRFAR